MRRTTKTQREIKVPEIFELSYVKKGNAQLKASGWRP